MTREQRLIRKAVEELEKDNPDLSYLRGMLESLVEEDVDFFEIGRAYGIEEAHPATSFINDKGKMDDEAAILDAQARTAIETMRNLPNIE